MYYPNIYSENKSKKLAANKNIKPSNPLLEKTIIMEGANKDIVENYFWHMNFAYFVGKGYKALKLEDQHYFSENSQFGAGFRQIKGGSIRAFQENLNQMIQLIKVHLMPLLKEVKQAEFYAQWIENIVKNDEIYHKLISSGKTKDSEEVKKAKKERDEAINHIKDKWVNEVDAGRMWQMGRSATEQGLDFVLLPQLFFGINLDDPLQRKKTLKEQLDEDVYPIDISEGAKEQVARFMYRFYIWLPTAINETQVTFKIKIAALRQFYAQLEMYANFMKPLLIEINRKTEGFEKSNFFHDFESENPEFVTLFDYSYSFVKVAGIREFERAGYTPAHLEFENQYGLFIDKKDSKMNQIISGPYKGKSGYIMGISKDGKYEFLLSDSRINSFENFENLKRKWDEKPTFLEKNDMRSFPVIVFEFIQKRRQQTRNTPQGPMPVPVMTNQINYKSYVWNLFEIAIYRERLKEENLDLLSSFIEEISIIKVDLMKYVSKIKTLPVSETSFNSQSQASKKFSPEDSLLLAPFIGFASILSPLLPNFSFSKSKEKIAKGKELSSRDMHHHTNELKVIEDTWKMYVVHKKAFAYMQY